MCGISGGWLSAGEKLGSLSHRGPDGFGRFNSKGLTLNHHRLAILDLSDASGQPFRRGDLTLVFNGEIWNYRELRDELALLGEEFRTSGDTEVLAAVLSRWGWRGLPRIQGMFAVAWTADEGETLWLARDRHGEAPLHVTCDSGPLLFSSETKALPSNRASAMMEPGTVRQFSRKGGWARAWYTAGSLESATSFEEAVPLVRAMVDEGARERTVSDVPVCALLSGGIDSAAVVWGLTKVVPNLVAYVAVMDSKSPDLRCARLVAEALGVTLVEVPVPAPTADDYRQVVRVIEMPYKAQVEIGWACLLLAQRMKVDGFKVTYSGEGSDELWASYGNSFFGVRAKGFGPYRRELFRTQHRKNFPRANKAFMYQGVECRLPFLNTGLVELALSLKESSVRRGNRRKAVLQDAFADVLPPEVIRRQKLAFQDGLGIKPSFEAAALAEGRTPRDAYMKAYREEFPGATGNVSRGDDE